MCLTNFLIFRKVYFLTTGNIFMKFVELSDQLLFHVKIQDNGIFVRSLPGPEVSKLFHAVLNSAEHEI